MPDLQVGNKHTISDVERNPQIFKNYVKKIEQKIDDLMPNQVMKCHDFNSMIIWFNWCFFTRNDFFVTNLHTTCLRSVLRLYNQIKTNMLDQWEPDLFNHLTIRDFKLLKFLLHQYINQFDSLTDDFNAVLKKAVSKESIQNCITQINIYIDNNADALSVHNHSNVTADTHTGKRSNQ